MLEFQAFAWRGIYMTAELVKTWLISALISGNLAIWTGSCIRKSIILMFLSSSREIYAFVTKLSDRCFCWCPSRWAPTWPHPIQISINLDDTLLRIARELKTAETWFLARLFILQFSIISQILEFIYWTVTVFSFDHMTDENREY